jgi:hypothetical protein
MEGMSMGLKRRRRNTPEANSARLMKVVLLTRVKMTAVLIILLKKSPCSSRPVPWVAPMVGKAQLPHQW